MAKPSPDNKLTKELLHLRDGSWPEVRELEKFDAEYRISVNFSGPGFKIDMSVSGERFAIQKFLEDFTKSIRDM